MTDKIAYTKTVWDILVTLQRFGGLDMKMETKNDAPLLEYLYAALAPQSRTKIKSLLTGSRIAVNGTVRTAFDYPLKAGDAITVIGKDEVPDARRCVLQDRRLKIVYEDKWLIVADKRSGLPVISTGRENEVTAYSLLTDYVRMKEKGRIFIVHRIDRDTSGLLVFAKDEQTKRLLQDNWQDAVLERKYSGVAEGYFEKSEGTIVSWLTENPKSLKVSASPTDNGGKKSVMHYQVAKSRNGLSFLEIELETGRKNQIRAQLASVGHPLAGDRKYGARSNPFGRLALHAQTLSFVHPWTGEVLRFSSKSPFVV